MSGKLVNHAVNIGDLDVYYDEHYVQVTVDQKTVLFFLRDDEGDSLKSFAHAITELAGD